MSSMNGTGRPRDPTIDAVVLEATIRLLADRGYAGLRINDIAAASGVAKATIYRRWPTMTHLVISAIERALGDRAIVVTGDFDADLERLVVAGNSVLGDENTALAAIALDIHRQRDPQLRAAYRERVIEPFRAQVVSLIANALDANSISSDASPTDLADAIIGGLIYRVVILGERFSPAQAGDFARSLLNVPGSRAQPPEKRC